MATKKNLSVTKKIIAYQNKNLDQKAMQFKISDEEPNNVLINVKRFISVEEMVGFVDSVVSGLFDEDDNYNPTIYDFLFTYAVLAYYTDLKFDDPDNKVITDIVYSTNILCDISEFISEKQISAIRIAIEKKTEFKKQNVILAQTTLLNRNLQQLEICTDVLKKFSDQTENLDMESVSNAVINLAGKSESEIVNAVLNFKDMKDK